MNIYVFFNRHRDKLLVTIGLVIIILLIWAGYKITGTGFNTKNLWDWMELLIIPVVLGVGATIYNRAEEKAERRRALDKERQETLMAYFDEMHDLLLEHNLRDPEKGEEARIVAKARTVSALKNLDGHRLAQLLQFLTEVKLGGEELLQIQLVQVDLKRTNLFGVDLQGAYLEEVNMRGTDLRMANLQGAYLQKVNFQQWADLNGINLQEAHLYKTDFQKAFLNEAILQRVECSNKNNFKGAYLSRAKLQKANLYKANLQGAVLFGANLQGAALIGTNLQGANLKGANLLAANLYEANLRGVDLREAKIGMKRLVEAKSLKSATMPDGTKYEKWKANGCPNWNKVKTESKEKRA